MRVKGLGAVMAAVATAALSCLLSGQPASAHGLPELESYVRTLPAEWRSRARTIVEQCEVRKKHRVRVLLISYFPVVQRDGQLFLDPEVTGMVDRTLADVRTHVRKTTSHLRWALELGSTYHGLVDPRASCSLEYDIVKEVRYREPLPVSSFEIPWNPGIYRPDYVRILRREHICRLVESQRVDEVWLWGYHYGNIEPAESNMAGPFGDISNSERVADMPVCARTYTLYNYNYDRGLGEALENHGHHLEAIFRHVDWDGLFSDFVDPFGRPRPEVNSCGSVHMPPNTAADYDWRNPLVVRSDCQSWNPQGTGRRRLVSCLDWTCDDDSGATYKVWWMMSLPGKGNALWLDGRRLRNWWDLVGQFDAVMASGTGLLR